MRRLVVATTTCVVLLLAGLELHQVWGTVEASPQQKPSAASTKPATTPDSLDRLLAPIALYPDQLLAQMLLCAANPGKVATLGEWLASNTALKGSDLQDAAAKSGFEPPYVALVLFPQVVNAMATDQQWTTSLGQAFTADKSAVFDSIQRLRAKAKATGTLKSTPQQDVETRTTSSGQQVIVIEPANDQVVYVPQYNPNVVYTQPASTTVVVQESSSSSDAVAAGLIGFSAGIAIGAAIDNNYYYGPYGWHGGGAYMYNDAWDDWYDEREDMREDWQDHREDLVDERGDRAENAQEQRGDRAQNTQEQRTDRQQTRQENRPETQAQRDQRRADAQSKAQNRTSGTGATAQSATQSRTAGTSAESRGYSRDTSQATRERSGTRSDAFSGYSSGKSERAASSRGQRSRSSSGGGRRR
jgi:Protein of unknown function (DUF3300)